MSSIVTQWRDRARADLRVAQEILQPGWDYIAVVLFLAQQAAEKSLKALLQHRGIQFPRPHDIRFLGVLLNDESIFTLLEDVEEFSDFATIFRYPGLHEEPDLAETRHILAAVTQLFQAVLSRIPSDLHPTAL